jgi:pimeloyl-ACP methyl ester carboxylesterase
MFEVTDEGSAMTLEKVQLDRRMFRATELAAAAFALVLVAVSGYSQTVIKKEATASRLDTLQFDAVPQTAAAEICPFHINVPEEELVDLRRRIAATRCPDQETIADQSQGVKLAIMQELAHHWATDYDWRRVEPRLNAMPQFVTTTDGLDINFIHFRSKHANALPVIVTQGWPGSISEQLKIIGPLTVPTAYGGKGGHLAAWEQPELFSEEIRAAFRSIR